MYKNRFKAVLFLFLFAVAITNTFDISVVAEEKETEVSGFVIKQIAFNELPQWTKEILEKYKDEGKGEKIPASEVESALRNIFQKLEESGIDINQLFGGKRYTFYATDAKFRSASAYTVWGGADSPYNSVVLGAWSLVSSPVERTVPHELGHLIYFYYFGQNDYAWYKNFRGVSQYFDTDPIWGKRPIEMFAEDFIEVFFPQYKHRTEAKPLTKEEAEKLKAYIVSKIKEKEKKNGEPDPKFKGLLKLRELGIINKGKFLQSEVSEFGKKPITNRETINLFLGVIIHNRGISFDLLAGLSEHQKEIEKVNLNANATPESIYKVLAIFSKELGSSTYNYLDPYAIANLDEQEINYALVANLVANFLQS